MKVIVILVEPEKAGNLGLIARLCENFEVDELRLVSPKIPEEMMVEAELFASRAKETLSRAKIHENLRSALEDVDLSIATSAIVRRGGPNLRRRAITVSDLDHVFSEVEAESVAFVFGRESRGLSNDEIELCDLLLTIESSDKYRTLNLACSVAIVLHKTFLVRKKPKYRRLASRELVERAISYFTLLAQRAFRDERREKAVISFSRLLFRSLPDHREITLLLGVLRRIAEELDKRYIEGGGNEC